MSQFAGILLIVSLGVIMALLGIVWRDNRRTVARIEQFQRSWQHEIGPQRSLLAALDHYARARQQMLHAQRLLDTASPGGATCEQRRIALIEAQVAYDDAREALHEQLDQHHPPLETTAAGAAAVPTTPRRRDDVRDGTTRGRRR